jgi:hypothetical protein
VPTQWADEESRGHSERASASRGIAI